MLASRILKVINQGASLPEAFKSRPFTLLQLKETVLTPALRFCSVLATGFALAILGNSQLAAQTPAIPQLPAPPSQTPADSRQLEQLEPLKVLPSKGKRWALVVGVDKYADPQISPLRGAANDARILADTLVRYAGFPPDQVILLATDQPAERQPTRVNLLRRLSNLASAVPKDGLLLISFSGHGMERGGQAFLLPSDSQISDQISFLEDTAISVPRMRELIRATGVGQVMVLLDACRNDPGGRADAPNNMTQAYVNGFNFDVRNREVQAFATLYATAIGQRAYEYTEKQQGYFTWAIVEALKGGGANTNGEVTLSELVRYVQDAVPKRIAIDLGSGKQQRPFATIEGYKAEELVLSAPGAKSSTNSASVPSGSFVDPAAIELSFWDSIKTSTSPDDFKAYLDKYPDGQFSAIAKNKIRNGESAKSETRGSGDNATELAFWDSVKNSSSVEDLRFYLKKYPNGTFADLAESRIKALGLVTAVPAKDMMEGIWQGTSPGGDKKYDIRFTGDGRVVWTLQIGKLAVPFKGTWTRNGNVVSMELANANGDARKTSHMEGTVTGNKFEGTYGGKYTFITEKIQ
jgi:hypothetical protein